MMKINETNNKFYWLYKAGIFIILALPLLTLPNLFYPSDWGKAIVFRSVLAVLVFAVFYQILGKNSNIREKFIQLKNNKISWLLVGLLLLYFLASIFSVDPYFSFFGSPMRSGGFINFAFYIIFSLFLFYFLSKKDWPKFWDFSILIGILVSAVALMQFYSLFKNIFVATQTRPGSTIGNSIFLGIYLLFLFFMSAVLAIKEKARNKKIFYILSCLLFIYIILITGSRAAYLGLGAGLIYFLLFFPKKMRAIKIAAILILMAGTSVVVYANTQSKFPDFLEKNRIFSSIQPRLSINAFLEDARFPAWMTGIKAVSERPILGWGPENFSVGFNKYYTPSIGAEWWDRAHNILIQTASDAGILAALIYLALFVFLIWQLNKVEDKILARGLQAILIGYFIANFFSIDSPPIYILFFFTIGYCLCLTSKSAAEKETASKNLKPIKWGKPALAVLFVLLIIFLWQYNLNPLFINAKINDSEVFVSQNKCNQAMTLMDKAISSKSFLDSYARLKYVEYVKTCAGYQPQKNLEYTQKSIQLLKEVTNMQPTYARAWLFLGSLNTILAKQESDQGKKNELVKEAFLNLDKAEQFAPSHQEIFSERAKAYQVSGDYQAMHKESEKCLSIFKSAGSCYWTKALSEIYLKNYNAADEDIRLAEKYLFRVTAQSSLFDLVNAYADVQNYKKTIETYQKLIIWDDNRPEYHSSIAFAYYKMGEYAKAREQALLFLELMPQAKDEVNNFLKTLPY